MASLGPEYSKFLVVRKRSGASRPGFVPTNAYPTKGGKYALIAAQNCSIFKYLVTFIERKHLANDSTIEAPVRAPKLGELTPTRSLKNSR